MSKTIAEIYDEVVASEELTQEYLAAEQQGEEAILAFAAAHGCEATAEEVQEFVEAKLAEEGEIGLDDLEQVAGGSRKGWYPRPSLPEGCLPSQKPGLL